MAIRPATDKDVLKLVSERTDKLFGRAYLLWLFGIGVGLVKLKADKLTFSGIEYTIENPEVIQGLIFVGCILCYIAIAGVTTIFSLQWTNTNSRSLSRRMIYLAARPRFTLQHKTPREILVIKRVARKLHKFAALVGFFIGFFPLVHILLFERKPLWLAIETMFS